MKTEDSFLSCLSSYRKFVWFLSFSWICSIAFGLAFALYTQPYTVSLMRMADFGRVSIVGLACIILAPLYLSAIAVYFRRTGWIYTIATLKGISFGFGIFVFTAVFGSAGWLMRLLIAFSDSAMLVPLFLFWIRHLDGSQRYLRRDLIICTVSALLIGLADYFIISPYTTAMLAGF